MDTTPGQLFYRNDFACPSSPCIFGPRKEGGGDAEAAKNRGVPAHSPKAGIRLSVCLPACLRGCCGIWRRGAGPASSPQRLALLLFVSQPYGDRKRPQGRGTMAHSLGVRACRGAIGDTGRWPEGKHNLPAPTPWELTPPGDDGVHQWDAGHTHTPLP